MAKMRMAEMDVVRFNESDVIVASGVLKLSGFGDSKANTGSFTYKGNTYAASEISSLKSVLSGDGYGNTGDMYFRKTLESGSWYREDYLIEHDATHTEENGNDMWANNDFSGVYNYLGDNNWARIHQ